MDDCPQQSCFVPDTGCAQGLVDLSACPTYRGSGKDTSVPGPTDDVLLPWSGSALGLADLAFVAGRARPRIIATIGPQNAGKTTMLGAWYLLLGRGAADLRAGQFAGSFSLAGWEAVAESLRWAPGQAPGFPPHTASRSGRAPGLLHLSFRAGQKQPADYLFTDAPGEWFQKWAINKDGPEAAGARWIAEHADVFLLVADREALSGTGKGSARSALQLLAARVADERKSRPVALVWTKSDVPIAPAMEESVRQSVFDSIPEAEEFSVSITPGDNGEQQVDGALTRLLDWTLISRGPRTVLPSAPSGSGDPLFMYGVRSA
ncbi:TRAFAC clade GTPase domain-containing protein [Streptomyces mirabilis]|uniref:TRAFAC clade GTPase domain-containing protein n=1 Tax=Streptomyces mirabilis TaxID=68239 RepID=UPI00332CF5D0